MPMINQRAGRLFKWVEKEKETQIKAKRESEEKPVVLFQENDRFGAKANAICAKGDERTETKERGNATLHPEKNGTPASTMKDYNSYEPCCETSTVRNHNAPSVEVQCKERHELNNNQANTSVIDN
ncbi:hypothetical protein PIB30_027770 [Stylosanthes scabra]|uniref:Uncharacterized protein n=1 Tax=Stylosanthes scabra TaxID=79078 RepID=A0ABU6Z9F8_9FABA|nr:hypothetical protein [Stylosanthes scabra]